jgi:phasin
VRRLFVENRGESEINAPHNLYVALQQNPPYIRCSCDNARIWLRSGDIAMNNQGIDFEIPTSVRDLAAKSVDQARDAYSRFLEAAKQAHEMVNKSTDVMANGAKEFNDKAVKYTEQNMQAGFDLAQKLCSAKDFKEALDIQNKFARQQMETYAQQAQEMSRLMAQSAQKVNPTSGH